MFYEAFTYKLYFSQNFSLDSNLENGWIVDNPGRNIIQNGIPNSLEGTKFIFSREYASNLFKNGEVICGTTLSTVNISNGLKLNIRELEGENRSSSPFFESGEASQTIVCKMQPSIYDESPITVQHLNAYYLNTPMAFQMLSTAILVPILEENEIEEELPLSVPVKVIPSLFERILEANPWMSEDVAEAWARMAQARNVLEALIEKVDPNKALALPGHPNLYQLPSPGDGDCFFWSLTGEQRVTIVQILNHYLFNEDVPGLDRKHYQEILAEAIYREAFKPREGLPGDMIDEEILHLLRTYHELHTAKDRYIRMAMDILNLDQNHNDLALYVNQLYDVHNNGMATLAAQELLLIPGKTIEADDAIRAWCQKPVQIQAFMDTVIDSEEHIDVHWNLGEILGEILNFNVVICEMEDADTLKITCEHIVNEDFPTKYILYNGRNHFDVLLTEPCPIVLPERIDGEDEAFPLEKKVKPIEEENPEDRRNLINHQDFLVSESLYADVVLKGRKEEEYIALTDELEERKAILERKRAIMEENQENIRNNEIRLERIFGKAPAPERHPFVRSSNELNEIIKFQLEEIADLSEEMTLLSVEIDQQEEALYARYTDGCEKMNIVSLHLPK